MRRAVLLFLGLVACCPRPLVRPTAPSSPAKACAVTRAPAWRPVALSSCAGWAACLSVADGQVLATDIAELRAWARATESSCPEAAPPATAPDNLARVAPAH